jgi:urea transport system ATP-binding protein
MLKVDSLHQAYGGSHILRGLSFEVETGKVTTLLGRNGVGKTTLLKALMGTVKTREGSITFDGRDITHLPPHERVRAGIGYVPQGREIFPRLTVEENLLMGLATKPRGTPIPPRIFDMFPVLRQMLSRRGGDLSGGQQQQLAIGRALAMGPKLLILDEPTEGIQPSIIKEMARTLKRIRDERGLSIVVSEQVLSFALDIADRVLVIENGEIVRDDKRDAVDAAQISKFLSV